MKFDCFIDNWKEFNVIWLKNQYECEWGICNFDNQWNYDRVMDTQGILMCVASEDKSAWSDITEELL